ncbi:DUF6127 family protein [Sphingomonas quercus]|uniref:Transmembrane protein n=1 Tax=Sphingomonas quercus TaxID=2842451 RepID=A0ABS6BKW0_9SPHN|nr:DUF6127 family protein [Sphingomonas quercus]MBU3078477.1 hypothetical protein [Sphingomonas quercus]
MRDDVETLTRLIAQADGKGCDLLMLRAIAEEASELGAARAMERLGLADPDAHGDIGELRELLGAWRAAKRSARGAAIAWVVRSLLAMLLVAIAVKLGFSGRFFR